MSTADDASSSGGGGSERQASRYTSSAASFSSRGCRRRAGSIASSAAGEIERVRSRLSEALTEVEAAEEQNRELEKEVVRLAGLLKARVAEFEGTRDDNEVLTHEVMVLKQARKKVQEELSEKKRDCANLRSVLQEQEKEADARAAVAGDESVQRCDILSCLLQEASHIEAAALRKQIKEMQLRMDGIVEMGRESLRVQHARPAPAGLEGVKEELAAMRKEKNEALGALRAERAAHAALQERFASVQEARDDALQQLADLPDFEEKIRQLNRSRLGEASWKTDKAILDDTLQQRTAELATMTRKRDRAKRREQEATQELAKARAALLEYHQLIFQVQQQQCGVSDLAHLAPCSSSSSSSSSSSCISSSAGGSGSFHPSRTETPVSNAQHLQQPPPQQPLLPQPVVRDSRGAEVAFLRSRVRELTHQGRYASGFATPPPTVTPAP